jgi:transcriptional regulator with XRE-family HTH domain
MRGGGMNKEINYTALGDRIRRSREAERLTQEQLAEICSLSAAHVGHIERGTRIPSLEALYKISTSLHVAIDHLLLGSFSPDEVLLCNINALLKSKDKLKPKTLVSTIRALADKIDEL